MRRNKERKKPIVRGRRKKEAYSEGEEEERSL